jgi:hypothetical protein
MRIFAPAALLCALASGSALRAASQTASVTHLAALGRGNAVELEIASSQPISPRTQVVTGPDRLVLDFPNATPGVALRNLSVGRGEVKQIRVGLFSANPPVTRIVVDLKSAANYQLFPSGKTLIVKFSATGESAPTRPSLIPASFPVAAAPGAVVPPPRVVVNFENGLLSIHADKATMAEVLYEVHRKTGADIPVPAGAEQEQVFVDLSPAPAREVMASLLNGSRFNFIMVGSDRDPSELRSVLLSPKEAGTFAPPDYSVVSAPPPPVTQYSPEPEPPPAPDPSEMPTEQPAPDDTGNPQR